MKKLFALLLTVLVIFSLVSCGAQMDNAMGEGLKGETSSTSSPEANDLAERKIIRRVSKLTRVPVIAGGLISEKEDVMAALSADAISVSTTNPQIWRL